MANPAPLTTQLEAGRTSWQPGQSGNPAGRPKNTPLVTPRMRHYAEWSYIELEALAHSPEVDLLPMKDAIAITWLLKAARDIDGGDKAREDIVRRLDGKEPDVQVEVNVAVGIALKWDDGAEA